MVLQHWHGPLLLQVLTLPEQPTIVLRHALRPHAARLVPLLAAVLERDTSWTCP